VGEAKRRKEAVLNGPCPCGSAKSGRPCCFNGRDWHKFPAVLALKALPPASRASPGKQPADPPLQKTEFAGDSPLEQAGFEPSVPSSIALRPTDGTPDPEIVASVETPAPLGVLSDQIGYTLPCTILTMRKARHSFYSSSQDGD
jgi:hypothetical protein